MEIVKAADNLQQYLTFALAGEEYAISILRIREIIEYGQVTKVPRMPDWVRGVINLRGSVVPVFDLAVKFGMPETRTSSVSCVILVEVEIEGENLLMGVVAESVSQVVDLASTDIQAPPAFGTKLRAEFLLGLANIGNKFAMILNIDKILRAEELLAAVAETEGEPLEAAVPLVAEGGASSVAG